MAEARKTSVEEVDLATEKEALGSVHGIDANPAAAALAAVTEAEKPRMFSKGMIRLWLIVRFIGCILWDSPINFASAPSATSSPRSTAMTAR
jgi:hypothetical protein